MSSDPRHLPGARRTPRDNIGRSESIEASLEAFGLISNRPSHKPKRKAVEFKTPASAGGSGYFRPSSRTSTLLSDNSTSRSGGVGHSRSGRGMAGILDIDRSNSRKDRTFIGSECAVCEEPLEHTLRGERILQLTCAHVAHEACFYEYIREFESQYCPTCNAPLGLDSSRGGNVLDLGTWKTTTQANGSLTGRAEKLSRIAKSEQSSERQDYARSVLSSPAPWEGRIPDTPASIREQPLRSQRSAEPVGPRARANTAGSERTATLSHTRNDSSVTAGDYSEPHSAYPRRHDYDLQSMEASLSSPPGIIKNPIPPPTVTVRSEFPTITRSRQQQSLTCLVTVEVTEGKWRPTVEDLRPPLPPKGASGDFSSLRSPRPHRRNNSTYESRQQLEEVTEDLHNRVDNWHGLDFSRFGKLRLHGHIRVGKDRRAWQDLDCYLFSEMLICVKERKAPPGQQFDGPSESKKAKCTLKGSILIKKHLKEVETFMDEHILTLSLSVAELPSFHLQFETRDQLEIWKTALLDINNPNPPPPLRSPDYDLENSGTDDEDFSVSDMKKQRLSSAVSSYGAGKSYNTAPTEYSSRTETFDRRLSGRSLHVPLDIVVVIPVSSSMQGLKISLLRDSLKFLVTNLGERDRMGLVTFGSSGGGVPLVGMTSKTWDGWSKILESIKPVGQKALRADVVEGANVAMDLLMQRKSANPLASILLISDSSTSDPEGVDFVVQRAEAAKVTVHSFGLGLTHKPDTMIELSTRTKASYTYVKDWMMLRECVAGCLGSLQTTSHQNVKLKLRLPEGSPAKFAKISGALQITKRASGRDAEAALGDMRFGDKRDVLVQLAIAPDNSSSEQLPQDPWETIVSGLEALGGGSEEEGQRSASVEEVPLIQADLIYGDILRDGAIAHTARPSLLAITMLPSGGRTKSMNRPLSPPIPPHPHVVQRRMELLTSDMLTRALTLVSRGQHERAHHLLRETRSILKGLGKGGLPPLPPPGNATPRLPSVRSPASATKSTISDEDGKDKAAPKSPAMDEPPKTPSDVPNRKHTPSPPMPPPVGADGNPFNPAAGIDARTMSALDAELESSLEWINHPAVFGRDSRKAVLQAIGVISSQRGYTYRTPAEALWAERIAGIKRLAERSREWRESGEGDMGIMEEA